MLNEALVDDRESSTRHSDRRHLLRINGGAPATTARRAARLRDLISTVGGEGDDTVAPVRQLRPGHDLGLVADPLVVSGRSVLTDLLAVVAPRRSLGIAEVSRSANKVASWLFDDPSARSISTDDAVQRFVAAGVSDERLSSIGHDDTSAHDTAFLRDQAAAALGLPTDRPWVLHLCSIKNGRDALAVAASLRRELRYLGGERRPLLVVAGAGTDSRVLRRVVSRRAAGDVVFLGEVADPTWLIAAADAIVLLDGTHPTGLRTLKSHPAFAPSRLVPRLRTRTLILGSGQSAREIGGVLADRRSSNDVVGFLTRDRARVGMTFLDKPVLGTFDDLFSVVEREQIKSIVVSPGIHDHQLPTEALLDLKTTGVEVIAGMKLLEQISGRIYIDEITPFRVIFSDGFRRPRVVTALKRATDAAVAGIGLVVLAPVFACIGVVIRLDSPGPIFYRQLRIGLNGHPFSIWKFRSMRTDAETLHAPVWASEEDPRITRVGRWMRKWRIDELPQLINVLRGEMSLVGPRPERPIFVQNLRRDIGYYDLRHTVRPGITGWAQVRFPYAASIEESYQKLQYDLYYVKHMSLRLDLRIAAETLRVMVRGEGAR